MQPDADEQLGPPEAGPALRALPTEELLKLLVELVGAPEVGALPTNVAGLRRERDQIARRVEVLEERLNEVRRIVGGGTTLKEERTRIARHLLAIVNAIAFAELPAEQPKERDGTWRWHWLMCGVLGYCQTELGVAHESGEDASTWREDAARMGIDWSKVVLERAPTAPSRDAAGQRSALDSVRAALGDLSSGDPLADIATILRGSDEMARTVSELRAEVECLREQRDAVERELERNGCDCECDHHWEDHDDDCERCFACRVEMAIGPKVTRG